MGVFVCGCVWWLGGHVGGGGEMGCELVRPGVCNSQIQPVNNAGAGWEQQTTGMIWSMVLTFAPVSTTTSAIRYYLRNVAKCKIQDIILYDSSRNVK